MWLKKYSEIARIATGLLPRRLWISLLDPRRVALLEACLIGLVSGLAAVLLKQGIGLVGGLRVHHTEGFPVWLKLPLFGLVGGLIAGWLIDRFAPQATGSGVSHVKAELASPQLNHQGFTLNLRLAAVKLLSTILVAGSGLALGRQGPTVHMGAALAASMSRWIPTSPTYRRQTIAAGAAAGLAAGFNAPISGMLFAIEELLHDVSSLTLGTVILASFVGAVVSRILGGENWDLNLELTASLAQFSALDIPFLLLLGIATGVLSGWFNRGIVASLELNRRLPFGLPGRIALAGAISGAAIAALPAPFRDSTGLREFISTGEAGIEIVAVALVVKFVLTLVAYGSGASGGLFAPTLVLGSALGRLVGLSSQTLFDIGDPTTYALAGMGAFFGAVAKVPITAIVIVFEITTDFNLVLPLMIVSVTAYVVAEQVSSGSLYDRLLEMRGWSAPTASVEGQVLSELVAAQVMQRQVETFDSHMALKDVMTAFSKSNHRGFPVVDRSRLVGIITQADLTNISTRQLPEDTPLEQVMTPKPVVVRPEDTLTQVLYLLERHNVSRLPVVDGRRLVGIVTRSDIIQAESRKLTGRGDEFRKVEPSYPVYLTRDPAVGQGRVLVPLANPKTAPLLLQFAAAIAKANDYELECLQVVAVPPHRSPSETPVRTTSSRRLLKTASRIGRQWNVPVHTQVRVAHDVAAAVLETLQERHIDKLLMGWKGGTRTPGRIFGDVSDTLLHQAACEVILVKWGKFVPLETSRTSSLSLDRWLVSVGGGANASAGLRLLPGLVSLGKQTTVRLCQVFPPTPNEPDTSFLNATAQQLDRQLKGRVFALPSFGLSVADAVVDLARSHDYDAVLIGASRRSLLGRALQGNIPREIARRCDRTVVLVRAALTEKDEV
ncbi:chloride channel protein [Baaleninema simplex]|uniref:chloride channel protein n=1 Tax=Baaleninema simplex TaxID=2862350 RepID=UPI0003469E3A|nr:chloride channel protein [Baaleninema simplex]